MTPTHAEPAGALARRLVDVLRARDERIAVAESCTGGGLGRMLTARAGASDVFWGGVIAYADEAKERLVGVPPEWIARHGAVSEPVARALAEGVRDRAGVEWSVSITGVAGPGGGSEAKRVGTVWIGVAGPDGTTARHRRLPGNRTEVRRAAVESALGDALERIDPGGGGAS